jgi:LysM repeat protein
MKIRLNTKTLFILLFFSNLANSQSLNKSYLLYIEQYNQLAVKQQKEYGIPASITLAQGLLESGAGVSPFAKESNNHFGIKCNDWAGEKVYHDDDEKGECFRKYNEVVESYEDHSLFLKNRKRYAFLFELAPTDYEGWAFGLKKAGYATDPTYGYKLISIIENYQLHKYDLGERTADVTVVSEIKKEKHDSKETTGPIGSINPMITHELMRVNHVKFVSALPDDSYKLIAEEFNMSLDRLLAYNDLTNEPALQAGTRVFVEAKKNKAPKECLTHVVEDGESMRSIAQDYGVKVVSLYKLNKIPFTDGAKPGFELKLR